MLSSNADKFDSEGTADCPKPLFFIKKIVLLGLLIAFLSQRTVSVSEGSPSFLDDVTCGEKQLLSHFILALDFILVISL